jgi:drug/metabolite transporter (DMT)-like permease
MGLGSPSPSASDACERASVTAHLALLAAGVLFGTTFVVVKDAVTDVEPIPFLAVRFLLGGLVMVPLAVRAPGRPGEARAGVLAGLALVAGYVLQTVGLQYTTASISAFITYLLVVMVPVIAVVALRRPPTPPTVAGVILGTIGLFLLTGKGLALGRGELLTLGCAFSFAIHVILLAEFAPRFDVRRLNAIQLLVTGGLCLVPGLFLGGYDFTARAWGAAVYTAVAVSAAALWLQLWGQRHVGPTRASLLLMIEPVSAALLGYVLGERLGARGALGAAVIMVGIAVAEAPVLRRRSP